MILPKVGQFYFRKDDNMLVEVIELDQYAVYYRDFNRAEDDNTVMGCHKFYWTDRFKILDVDNEVINTGGIF